MKLKALACLAMCNLRNRARRRERKLWPHSPRAAVGRAMSASITIPRVHSRLLLGLTLLVALSARAGEPSRPDPEASPSATATPIERVVSFNTKTHKYHCPSCSAALRCTKNCVTVELSRAQKSGAVACKLCNGTCK